jgi:flavin reductase (DIM6/NTAB) family NADH-FMN oxidoreductase RutF
VPEHKLPWGRFESAKFAAAGLRPLISETVVPPRVAECPLQLEATAVDVRRDAGGEFVLVEAAVRRVHAAEPLVVPGTQHVDPAAWRPLIYNFRHYYGLGADHEQTGQFDRVVAVKLTAISSSPAVAT